MERKEAIEAIKKNWTDSSFTMLREALETLIPELKESGDGKIRKGLIEFLKSASGGFLNSAIRCETFQEWLAWLEKQSEPQVRTNIEWVNAIDNACNERYTEEYSHGEYCHEQSFKWGFQEGVEWLKKRGEQKIADKYNITGIKSKHAEGKLGEMIKEIESANKVDPKFKVGDWIYHEISGNVFHINRIENRTYISDEGATISFGRQNDWRLWNIQDAKDGDVLYLQKDGKEHIIIYKGVIKERFRTFVSAYCAYNGIVDAFCFADVSRYVDIAYKGIMPATKEQRDLLFQKMKESGYEWDTDKKELINKIEPKFKVGDIISDGFSEVKIISIEKNNYIVTNDEIKNDAHICNWVVYFKDQDNWKLVEQKSTWSEEDEEVLNLIIARLHSHPNVDLEEYSKEYNWLNYNLKSLKERYSWKPTEEQLKQLRKYCPDNTALTALYEYLKQL